MHISSLFGCDFKMKCFDELSSISSVIYYIIDIHLHLHSTGNVELSNCLETKSYGFGPKHL